MRHARRQFGDRIETAAADFLERRGFRITDRNWSVREGEIDIVAQTDDLCVFVEVRARRSAARGEAIESIGPRKVARLLAAVGAYEAAHPDLPDQRRIDVITVDPGPAGLRMRWHRDVIEGE